MGIHDPAAVQASFVSFLRSINALLLTDPDLFWAPHEHLVATVLDETRQANEQALQERIAVARIRYEGRLRDLTGDQLNVLITLEETEAQQRAERADYIDAVVKLCPVCEHLALVEGDTQETGWVVDADDGVVTNAWPILTFFPSSMHCRICGLILEEAEDFILAGLGESWWNEDVDLDVWFERTYEPDYETSP